MRVYTRRKRTTELQPVEQQAEQTQFKLQPEKQSQEQPQSFDVGADGTDMDQSIETGGEMAEPSINLPIGLRKEARSTTGKPPTRYGFEHDISNYVSYESLSLTYRAFIASLQYVRIPKYWKEAVHDPKWHDAMLEELRALEKNETWDLVKLPSEKKVVSCKWIFSMKQNPEGKVGC